MPSEFIPAQYSASKGTEIEQILQNVQGAKQLVLFPIAGHNLLVTVDKKRWAQSVEQFLRRL
ncbi:MAG: hypothetical protein RID09_31595 [Coleofasciculus sp. G1-WW12-02]|uniref:hypothetical protein n=1 Tax=Coleofasciculus sp. G1-WW12-02 TaxID=3068483 RepID=UPI0032F41877